MMSAFFSGSPRQSVWCGPRGIMHIPRKHACTTTRSLVSHPVPYRPVPSPRAVYRRAPRTNAHPWPRERERGHPHAPPHLAQHLTACNRQARAGDAEKEKRNARVVREDGVSSHQPRLHAARADSHVDQQHRDRNHQVRLTLRLARPQERNLPPFLQQRKTVDVYVLR